MKPKKGEYWMADYPIEWEGFKETIVVEVISSGYTDKYNLGMKYDVAVIESNSSEYIKGDTFALWEGSLKHWKRCLGYNTPLWKVLNEV